MPNKKVIGVFGATGAQGGGLAHSILNDPDSEFTVRAITRDANSDKARQLAQKGAEIVTADIDDPDVLKKALVGAYGVLNPELKSFKMWLEEYGNQIPIG